MAIIIEGPDNSGKTTLAEKLSKILMMPLFRAGGPPGSNELAELACQRQFELSQHCVILDRITPVSRQIYENRLRDPTLSDWLSRFVSHPRNIFIYCRPPNEKLMDMTTHEVKPYDTDEHIAYVLENQHNFIELYDRLMVTIPCFIYDWTDNMDLNVFAVELFFSQKIDGYKHTITGRRV